MIFNFLESNVFVSISLIKLTYYHEANDFYFFLDKYKANQLR